MIRTNPPDISSSEVIDECLRAASGFKGADDLLKLRLWDIQLMSNTTRKKRVASAPSYEIDILDSPNKDLTDHSSAVKQWSEVIQKHLPLAICHCAPMIKSNAVRALGHISRFLNFNCYSMLNEVIKIPSESFHSVESHDFSKISFCKENSSPVFTSSGSSRAKYGDPRWLERMVQAFLSCVTTGNVKKAQFLEGWLKFSLCSSLVESLR